MADLIQFNCPVCGTTLRLPLEMAASQGPCPCCGREIVAPDPYRGIGAHEPAPRLQARLPEPVRRFADSPPLVPKSEPVEEVEQPAAPAVSKPVQAAPLVTVQRADTAASSPHRAILVLSILLTAVVSLVTGYIVGARSNWLVSTTPFPVMAPKLEETDKQPAAETKPVLLKIESPEVKPEPEPKKEPLPEPSPESGKQAEPLKASALAEAALRAFLDAPDWTARSAYVLFPDKVRVSMEDYSHKVPDGPTPFKSISVQNSYTDKKTGNTLFIFAVVTEQHPSGFPVAVAETQKGWNVDWKAFVEFRDDHFKSFADGPNGQTGTFHLIVSPPPPSRAANTENEHFTSYLLDPPLSGRQRIAYVRKSSEAHAALAAATANGTMFTPVLELEKMKTPDGKSYLEIKKIVATDWLPVED